MEKVPLSGTGLKKFKKKLKKSRWLELVYGPEIKKPRFFSWRRAAFALGLYLLGVLSLSLCLCFGLIDTYGPGCDREWCNWFVFLIPTVVSTVVLFVSTALTWGLLEFV
ncbi:hypothetical protein MUP65_02050, partial [Patescibacteria group bacterium]|nr:hypothetical protein [Patescibacteria group bacterium]